MLDQGFSNKGHGILTRGHERNDNVAIPALFTVVPLFLFKFLSNLYKHKNTKTYIYINTQTYINTQFI